MTLRCRKGDMAVMIKGYYSGYIVTIVAYDGFNPIHGHEWRIETSVSLPKGSEFWFCPDAWLLPIRPGDLQEHDETEKELTA